MFEQTLLPVPERGPQSASFVASIAAQFLIVAALLLMPLFFIEALPMVKLDSRLFAPPMPKPIPVMLVAVPKALAAAFRSVSPARIYAPRRIPDQVPIIHDEQLPEASPGVVIQGPVLSDFSGPGLPGAVVTPSILPPPPKPTQPAERVVEKTSEPVRVSAGVQLAKLVKRVMPVYPPLAKQARIQGTVRLVGVIAEDGRIKNLQVLSGHPLLVPAALEAVRQWIYQPTLLNSKAVEVIAPIDVNFTLTQ